MRNHRGNFWSFLTNFVVFLACRGHVNVRILSWTQWIIHHVQIRWMVHRIPYLYFPHFFLFIFLILFCNTYILFFFQIRWTIHVSKHDEWFIILNLINWPWPCLRGGTDVTPADRIKAIFININLSRLF